MDRRQGRKLLAKCIDEHHGTQASFAKRVGCSEPHLSLVLKGKNVSVPLAKRISRATGGTVPAYVLVRSDIAELLAGAAA